jgi:hypothetical protein
MLGQIEGDTNCPRFCTGEVYETGRRCLGIAYEEAVDEQAVFYTTGDGPYQHASFEAECDLAYGFKGVLLFECYNGYTAVAAVYQLFESLNIIHSMPPCLNFIIKNASRFQSGYKQQIFL